MALKSKLCLDLLVSYCSFNLPVTTKACCGSLVKMQYSVVAY